MASEALLHGQGFGEEEAGGRAWAPGSDAEIGGCQARLPRARAGGFLRLQVPSFQARERQGSPWEGDF